MPKIAMNSAAILTDRAFFPMFVALAGRKCVVVGAGKIAAARVNGLLACGASVTVIGPRAVSAIQRHACAGALTWRRRAFSARDLKGAFLAVAATNSCETNAAVFRACTTRCIFCNSVDDPEHCDFIYPAVVHSGPLQIAISTGGRSPALAARLRHQLQRQFGPEWSAWVEHIGQLRDGVLHSNLFAAARRERLRKLASPAAFRAFLRKCNGNALRKKHP